MKSDKVPFKLNVGRMISQTRNLENDLQDTLDQKMNFLVTSIFHPNYPVNKQSNLLRNEPIAKPDKLIAQDDWANYIVVNCARSYDFESSNPRIRKEAKFLFKQEVHYAEHVGAYSMIIPCPSASPVQYARIVNKINEKRSVNFWVMIPFRDGTEFEDPDTVWRNYMHFKSLLNNTVDLSVCLDVGEDLPDNKIINRWMAEDIKAAVIRTKLFTSSNKDLPILSGKHDTFVKSLFRRRVNFILRGKANTEDLSEHYNYLRTAFTKQDKYSELEYLAFDYFDVAQIPLQPLKENLQSHIYGYFEKDKKKYDMYQEAIYYALMENFKPDEKITLMVLGAGRAPIVHAAFQAAEKADRNVHVYAIEKNPNAIVSIRQYMITHPKFAQRMTLVHTDMREWVPPTLADVIVSELLGSFGDNELSPECLEPAQRLLKKGGINIPYEYTSFLEPISHPILHNKLKNKMLKYAGMEHIAVVRFLTYYRPSNIQACFRFEHPDAKQEGFNRFKSLEFKFEQEALIHGFAGYFEAKLYKDVKISINPVDHTPDMYSWFPVFIPLETVFTVDTNKILRLNIWRQKTKKKVWYEWQADNLDAETGKPIVVSRVYNLNGSGSCIDLL